MSNEIFMVDKQWFNPVNVIYEFKRLEAAGIIHPKVKNYKKLQEAYITAVQLVGLVSVMKLNFWLQIVDDREGSPDIRTISPDPRGAVNEFLIQDVEVVIFGKYSANDIVEFLAKTKLSDEKGYDDLTNVLCFVDKYAELPSVIEINKALLAKNLSKKFPIMLMGKIFENQEKYRLVQIYPDMGIDITFDVMEECKKITYPGGLKFSGKGKKGEVPKFINDGSKIYPFKNLGFE